MYKGMSSLTCILSSNCLSMRSSFLTKRVRQVYMYRCTERLIAYVSYPTFQLTICCKNGSHQE